jgi:flavodoxin
MKLIQTISAILAMSALLVALSGCEKQEGPMEQAGKRVDQGMEKAGEQIEKAGDSIQNATKLD